MAQALTIRNLIPRSNPAHWLEHTLPETAVGRQLSGVLPKVARGALASLLSDEVDKLLDLDLLELFVSAWVKHRELAALSLHEGEGELIELIDHRMSSIHEPKVEVLLDGKPVFDLAVTIAFELEFRGVQLLLRGGRVREVHLGELEGKGSLEIAGQEVAEQLLGKLELPGVLKLDPGIPLAKASDPAS